MAMPDPKVEQLDKYYEQLKSQQTDYHDLWRDLITYVRPLRSTPLVQAYTVGKSQMAAVYSSTAIGANGTLASAMQGSLTSNAFRWFSLRMRLEELNEDQPTQIWLDQCANRIFKTLAASNLGAQGIESYLDLGAFGVSAMLMTELPSKTPGARFGGLDFKTIGLGSYVIAEGMDGTVDTFGRCFAKPAGAILRQWPKTASDELRTVAANTPFEMLEVVHAIYPYETYGGTPAHGKPYGSVYYLKKDKTLLSEDGYWEFPVLVPRWAKADMEIYGRGPGHVALYDVKTLNRAKELGLKAWDKAIDPPMKALAEGVVGSVRMQPAGLTYVQDMNALQPLLTGAMANLQWTQVEVAALRQAIKEAFYNSQLELPNQPYMTAEEIVKRYELMERLLGPTLGRLESEYLQPMIRRAFLLLYRAGMLPPPPPAVQRAFQQGVSEIDIQYEGPLARQQRYTEVEAIQRAIMVIKPLWEVKPEVLDNFRFDDIARKASIDSGMPPSLLESPEAVNKVRQDRAKMRAMQAQANLNQQRADTAASAGTALQAGAQAAATTVDAQQAKQAMPPAEQGAQ